MNVTKQSGSGWAIALAIALGLFGPGCVHHKEMLLPPPDGTVPRELSKVTLPPYVIEAPDVLQVDVILAPFPENLATNRYSTYLDPQPVNGQYLVKMDGTILLGIYGSVQVAGLTIDQARERVRDFIAEQAKKTKDILQVTVDVVAYNSKQFYVITDGAGYGEQVHPFPITGSETVLDAMGRVGGLPAVGSRRRIWVARRSPHADCPEQKLPVDWVAITQCGITATNYQVLPGDRIYVQAEAIFRIDNAMAKFLSPIERTFGIVLLGSSTVNSIQGRFPGGTGTR